MSAQNKVCQVSGTNLRSPVVLVAEDEILLRAMFAQHLRSSGFRVLEASNAQEAVEILGSGEKVDVLFTDVRMPDENDGIALAQWMRQHHPLTRIAFGSADKDLVQAVPGAKIFAKPYDFEEVESHIRNLAMQAG